MFLLCCTNAACLKNAEGRNSTQWQCLSDADPGPCKMMDMCRCLTKLCACTSKAGFCLLKTQLQQPALCKTPE